MATAAATKATAITMKIGRTFDRLRGGATDVVPGGGGVELLWPTVVLLAAVVVEP